MSLGIGSSLDSWHKYGRQPAWWNDEPGSRIVKTPARRPMEAPTSMGREASSTVVTEHKQRRLKARNDDGMLIITGLDPVMQQTWLSSAQRNTNTEPATALPTSPNTSDAAAGDGNAQDMDELGPNERGTYSKEYTLRHPEVIWIHRGQGRYLPESQVSATNDRREPASSQASMLSEGRPARNIRRRRFSDGSDGDDDKPRSHSRHLSPRSARVSDSAYSFRRRPSDIQAAAESREARMVRRSGASLAVESQDVDDLDDSRSYTKAHVDSHPEHQFKHVGGGFYRQILNKTSMDDNAQPSQAPLTDPQSSFRSGTSISHQGRNPSVALSSQSNSTNDNNSASASPFDPDDLDMLNGDSFTKEQMLKYQKEHPNVIFIHRGNGRYKKITDVAVEVAHASTLDPRDRETFDKAWVDQHFDEEYYHCGYGRYKRGRKPSRPSVVSETEDGDEIPTGLVTKEYVDEHPEMTFHHRGQGRYALGPRPQEPSISASLLFVPITKQETLYDKDYVESHPDETFHHRGQGRWARGLPPPGSSNKMAVRGPGSSQLTRTSTTSSGAADVPAYAEADLPGLNDLVRKDEGPEKFPDIHWHYRGGGKWARISKEEADALARNGRYKQRQAEDDGRSLQPPPLKRKHSHLQSVESEDANDSAQQSGTSTPRARILTLEEDTLTEGDLLPVYRDQWSPLHEDELEDQAAQHLQAQYEPLTHVEDHIRLINKYDISTRPTETLYLLAEHMQNILRQYQDEYIELDKITAPHARIARKVVTGGRLPVDRQIFEDRKEADLYDYAFDPKRIGFQDPEAQKITRDVDGRELRKRRRRGELDIESMQAGEEAPLPRRIIKPVTRFDGVPGSTTRRSRVVDANKQASVTPDRIMTPEKGRSFTESYTAPTSGRWAGHVPKRIRELRGPSTMRQEVSDEEEESEDETELLTTRGTRSRPAAGTPTKATAARGVAIVDSIEDDSQTSGSLMDTSI